MQTIWKGAISFGVVNVPADLAPEEAATAKPAARAKTRRPKRTESS